MRDLSIYSHLFYTTDYFTVRCIYFQLVIVARCLSMRSCSFAIDSFVFVLFSSGIYIVRARVRSLLINVSLIRSMTTIE
jgi:hypothetical protein